MIPWISYMLDLLARVSRRVGWNTDRFATGPRHYGLTLSNVRRQSRRTATVHHSQASELDRGPVDTASVLCPALSPHRWTVTLSAEADDHLPTEHQTARTTEQSAPGSCLTGETLSVRILTPPPPGSRRVRADFPGPPVQIHPFDIIRFHVLLNSLQNSLKLFLLLLARCRTRASI